MLMKNLIHPNIIRLKEFWENDQFIKLVFQFIQGEDLLTFVKNRGILNEFVASKILKDLIKALIYLHSLGIMHRDIKPENVMIEINKSNSDFK